MIRAALLLALAVVATACAAQVETERPAADCSKPATILFQAPLTVAAIPGCAALPDTYYEGVHKHNFCCYQDDAPTLEQVAQLESGKP
jgi:hypothetical protein